jgi:hypothetical protein
MSQDVTRRQTLPEADHADLFTMLRAELSALEKDGVTSADEERAATQKLTGKAAGGRRGSE